MVKSLFFFIYFFQLQNAFDNLFDGLMEGKDGEKEAADVGASLYPFIHSHRLFGTLSAYVSFQNKRTIGLQFRIDPH